MSCLLLWATGDQSHEDPLRDIVEHSSELFHLRMGRLWHFSMNFHPSLAEGSPRRRLPLHAWVMPTPVFAQP